MPKLIDIHAHINFRDFKEDGDEVIRRALDRGVWMINVGSEYKTSQRAVEYEEKHDKGVYAAVGLHPIHLTERVFEEEVAGKKVKIKSRAEEYNVAQYRELALSPKVVAIGEIGLDYAVFVRERSERLQKRASAEIEDEGGLLQEERLKEKQKDVFKAQLQLAYQLKKPVIIHCRDAHQDAIKILQEFLKDKKTCPDKQRGFKGGTIHCFSGNLEQAQKYFELGFYISFTGLITFSNRWDEVIKKAPLEKLMVETDCPFMAPVPFRGKRNEPLYVEFVAKRIAELKGLSFEEAARATTENARNLFGI